MGVNYHIGNIMQEGIIILGTFVLYSTAWQIGASLPKGFGEFTIKGGSLRTMKEKELEFPLERICDDEK